MVAPLAGTLPKDVDKPVTVSSTPETGDTPSAIPAKRPRLEYLDGLRGIAALYVVLHHAFLEIAPRGLSPRLAHWTNWLRYGHYAVAVFIVLSGYCLMLPVARTPDGTLRGGALDFFRRRARRILPPYYAALLLCLAGFILLPELSMVSGNRQWDVSIPNWQDPGNIMAHVFLIQNLRHAWLYSIDHPMWSVATEWQIYFFFPFVLVPVWRRFGSVVLLAVGLVLGFLPIVLFHAVLMDACPWFLALFALGMTGAVVNFGARSKEPNKTGGAPWGAMAALLAVLFVWRATVDPGAASAVLSWPLTDMLVGATTVCLILFCTNSVLQRKRPPLILRLLDSRGAVLLGTFSYSLYLTHAPVLAIVAARMPANSVKPAVALVAEVLVGLPVALIFAYVFHRLFERPYMNLPAAKTAV